MSSSSADTARILVVDDEPQIHEVLQTSFAARGYEVRAADDGDTALQTFRGWRPDLVITDLSMPRMNGIALCRAIRASSDIPIIVLSVKGEEAAKVEALESGADDYVTKPFGMAEILARVRAALRRSSGENARGSVLEAGDFRVDLDARKVEIKGRTVSLTPKEFELLVYMLKNAEKIVTQKTLMTVIWGRTYFDQLDSVRVLVRQLRKKIEPNPASPKYLKTEPWVGYRFKP